MRLRGGLCRVHRPPQAKPAAAEEEEPEAPEEEPEVAAPEEPEAAANEVQLGFS